MENIYYALVQDRIGSTRLPKKTLLPLHESGLTPLEMVIKRLCMCSYIDKIVYAIPNTKENDILEKRILNFSDYVSVHNKKLFVYRGNENDVLGRCYFAMKQQVSLVKKDLSYKDIFDKTSKHIVVDVTADCPFIDPFMLREMLERSIVIDSDYYSNILVRSFPDGFDVQIYKVGFLYYLNEIVRNNLHRRHTGWNILYYINDINHMYDSTYNQAMVLENYKEDNIFYPEIGLTLDTKEDYELMKEIVTNFYPRIDFSCQEILDFLRQKPGLLEINKSIIRNTPGMG